MLTNLQYPSTTYQIFSAMIHFLGVSLLSHCLSRRLGAEDLSSFASIRGIPWPRLCIILIFVDSWLFLFTSGILVFGVGLQLNKHICSTAIFICIGFYATSKVLIYAYLIEKVHVVWSPSTGAKRLKSPIYIVCVIVLSMYTVVLALMTLVGNIHFIRSDGVCVIGLRSIASLPLLSYDLFINIALTLLFLFPLFARRILNPTVRRVATRTLSAATVALTTSFVNVLVLTLLHGKELGWICLGSCGTDVIINAVAIFWVTGFRNNAQSANAAHGDRIVSGADPSKIDVRANRATTLLVSGEQGKGHITIDVGKDAISTPQQPLGSSSASPVSTANNKAPSVFAKLFKKDRNKRRTSSIQVMVTTEYEMSEHCVEAEASPSNYREARRESKARSRP